MKIRAVIFDLDDTLYPERDYAVSGFSACTHILTDDSHKKEDILGELIRLFDEDSNYVFNRYAKKRGLPDGIVEDCLKTYRSHEPALTLNGEAVSILKWLKEKHIKIGLLTDGRPEGQRAKIKALNLECYMDSIVITDELGGSMFRKPNPEGYEAVLRDLRLEPQESVYVGDNLKKDFLAPNTMGMVSVLYTGIKGMYFNSKPPVGGLPQHIVDCLSKLKKVL